MAVNHERIKDVVIWYGAHLTDDTTHNAQDDDGTTGHIVGHDLVSISLQE
jgi:hypothetical protein